MPVTWDWVAIAAAAAAIASAVYAKVQANAAGEQVRLMKLQVDEAKKANALTEKIAADEVDRTKVKIDLSGRIQCVRDQTYLDITIANNGHMPATIQGVRAYFDSGPYNEMGNCTGEIEPLGTGTNKMSGLPGTLQVGRQCVFRFQLVAPREGLNIIKSGLDAAQWKVLNRVVVRASNQDFHVPPEAGWLKAMRAGW